MRDYKGTNSIEYRLAIALNDYRRRRYAQTHDQNWSQVMVAARAGISRAQLCQYETGVCLPPTLHMFRRWALALGCNIDVKLHTPDLHTPVDLPDKVIDDDHSISPLEIEE